jgi:hypothetical protein
VIGRSPASAGPDPPEVDSSVVPSEPRTVGGNRSGVLEGTSRNRSSSPAGNPGAGAARNAHVASRWTATA